MLPQSSMAADITLILLPLVIAFLSKLSSSAAVYVADSKLASDSQNGNKKASAILDMLTSDNDVELSVRLLNVFCMTASGISLFTLLLKVLPGDVHGKFYSLFFLLFILVFPLIFWSISFEAPKALSAYAPDKFAYSLTFFLKFSVYVTFPARLLCNALSGLVVIVSGHNPKEVPNFVTEEEIRMMVDEGGEKGTIEVNERRMINNVFEFDNHDVAEVMTHRKDVAAVPETATLMDVINLSNSTGYSRLAVYEEDIDNIVGFVYIKDLLKYIEADDVSGFDLSKEIRKPLYLPESCSCSDAFETFQKEKTQIAVVVDEYGGTYGIVTMEDVLETIFGTIQDEYDNEQAQITDMGNGVYSMDGNVTVAYFEEYFDVDIPDTFESDTVGGLVTEVLDHVPTAGEQLEEVVVGENIAFKVLEFDEKRITKVSARKLPEEEE